MVNNIIDDIWDKVINADNNYKACLKPCNELITYSTLNCEDVWINKSEVFLKLDKTVKVTKFMYTYGIFELVVDVGSSLGLWVGLSALGILDLLLQAASPAKKIFSKVYLWF